MRVDYTRNFLIFSLTLLFSFGLNAQRTVSGTITSGEGEPLTGVNVLVKGTTNGAISDLDGKYSIQASDGDLLIFSYIGMINQEMSASGSTIDIVMVEDATTLSDVVVTTTRQPVRKIETTTAISIIDTKLIESVRPEGFSEAIQGTPGVYTSQSQGRFRGSVFIRGFPDGSGNGLVYTGILIDGIPSLATPARPPDFAFGMDGNVERIEVVRGSAATLFGRASAAGVVNVISKVGGEKTKGSIRLTNYSENVSNRDGFDMKVEGNINGAFSKKLRFNMGGYVVNDRGFRDLGYNDRGGQFRANFDYLLDKGSVRVYGGYTNLSIQNMIDIPYRLSDNTPMAGWETTDSYYSENYDNYTSPINGFLGIPDGAYQITDKEGQTQFRSFRKANEEGNYARGGNLGVNFDYEIRDWLIVSNKIRYQSYDHGTKFNLGVSTFYFNDPNNPNLPVNLRILIDGDGTDSDVIDELRFTFPVDIGNTKHRFALGTYYSRGRYTPETYSWFHVASAEPDPQLGFFGDLLGSDGNPIMLPDGSTISVPTTVGASPVPFGSAARRDLYVINVNSFFIGDEMKIGEKATVNVGARWDKVRMDISGFYGNATTDIRNRKEEHSDYSASIGANYLLGERSAVYGNFVRAFRMPDYSAYTPADPNSLIDNPEITDNEIILNGEIGYRTGLGDLGVDAAVFYTNIKNRLATIYEGAIATLKPLGTNTIAGGELALTYAPSSVKGLLLRSSFTYQSATFDEFKISVAEADPTGNAYGNTFIREGANAAGDDVYSIDLQGNQVPRVPAIIFNVFANYDTKHFGVNASLNYFGNRYADATNIFKQDDIINVNAGAYVNLPLKDGTKFKISATIKNALNTDKALRFLYVSDNDALLARQQAIDAGNETADGTYYTGIPYLPRRILLSLAYEF